MKISARKDAQWEDDIKPHLALDNITGEDMLLHLAHLLRCDVSIRALRSNDTFS
jgi:hypothetical protein